MSHVNKNFLFNKLKISLKKSDLKFSFFKNAKVLITGGTGFIGSWIVHSFAALNLLHQLNIEIFIIIRNKKKQKIFSFINNLNKINYIYGDITKIKNLNYNFSHVFHCAGVYKDSKKNIFTTNIIGTKNIIKIISKNKIKNVIFLSSGAVYDKNNKKNIYKENDALNTNKKDFYSISKIRAENLFLKYCASKKDINLSILRLFSFAGPGCLNLNYLAYAEFMKRKLQNKDIIIQSKGIVKRSYMHPIDLSIWILKSSALKKIKILNVGSDKAYKLDTLAKKISSKKILKMKSVGIINLKNNKYIDSIYLPDVSKAKQLNFKILFNLDDCIKDHLRIKIFSKNENKYFFI